MFSSCLETIEPDGLSDLRGAKADLLRAQTALQEAQAAKVNAEAALKLAEAKVQEAIAAQEAAKVAIIEAEALLAQYQAEYQALVNAAYEAEKAFELEQAMAAAEAAKAAAELEAQKAAAQLELDLLDIQTQIIEAQAAYDHALKELAAAKATLSPGQKNYLFEFEMEVKKYEDEVEDLTAELEEAAEDLEKAIATVDENKADKLAIFYAERNVAAAEAALEGANEAVTIAEAALEIDPFVEDWAEKMEALADEFETLYKEQYENALAEYEELKPLEDSLEVLTEAYEKYESATGYPFDETTGEFSEIAYWVQETQTAPEIFIPSPKDEEGNDIFYSDVYYLYPEFVYGDADSHGVISWFDYNIEDYTNLSDPSYFEAYAKAFENAIAVVEKNSEEAMAQYEAAVAAYKAGDATAYFQELYDDEDWDPAARVAEYNAALEAYLKAVDNYITELKKYDDIDMTEDGEKLLAARKEAIAKADAARAKAYQDAYDVYNKAEQTYDKAEIAYERAERAYWTVIDASVAVVNAVDGAYMFSGTDRNNIAADITTALTAYETDKKATGFTDPDGKYAAAAVILKAELTKVNDAQKAWDDPDVLNEKDAKSVYEAAQEAWNKASNTYWDAYNKIDAEYDAAYDAAWEAYEDGITDLDLADNPLEMDSQNIAYLGRLVNEARARFYGGYVYEEEDYHTGSDIHVDGAKVGLITYVNVEDTYEVTVGEEGYYTYNFWNVPDYLVDVENETFKTIKVEDVVDMEFFLENEVRNRADNLVMTHRIDGYWYVDYPEYEWGSYIDVVIGAPEDYPLSLPTYESYAEALADYESVYEYIEDYFEAFRLECIAAGGDANYYGYSTYGTPFMSVIGYNQDIEDLDVQIANADVAAEFVKTLEAAKAEFEAYVAEFEAEIDAIRPVVEEGWAGIYEKLEEAEKAKDAVEAKFDEIFETYSYIQDLVYDYTDEYSVEDYVAALEDLYNDAVENVVIAEVALDEAKADLELVKAGGEDALDAVEMAQKAYDKINEELTEALANLEAAAKALQDAMVAVGAAEATPAE